MRSLLLAVCVLATSLVCAHPVEATPYFTTTLTLDQPAPVYHRDTVTFSDTLDHRIKNADVEVWCYQGPAIIYANILPAAGNAFYLESGWVYDQSGTLVRQWIGPADCRARLIDYRNNPTLYATVYFTAEEPAP